MVGVSGSGKSTLGRELAARLAVPYAELGAVFHRPEWTPLPEEDFPPPRERHRLRKWMGD
jgi:adenylate kinase family enzyme